MASKVQTRRDTYANWASNNPTLADGELAYETNTGLAKMGNGSTAYTSLAYFGPDTYRLTADRGAIGTTSAVDYFASAAYSMVAGGVYELTWELYFTKTTTNPVVFTVTTSQTPVNVVAYYTGGPIAGIGTAGAPITAAAVAGATTTTALPATSSLTTAVNHHFTVKAIIEGNATTAGTAKLQITCTTSGTVTPLRGSSVVVRQLPAANYGSFA